MQVSSAIPEALSWRDGLRVGHASMDAQHAALVSAIAALRHAPAAAVEAALRALTLHLREHFRDEEAWMADSAFPARDCHAAEHRAVLASLDGVTRRVAGGEPEAARRLAEALADWLPAHADHLDAPLAQWLCRRRHGGTPIVLHRLAPGVPDPEPRSPPC